MIGKTKVSLTPANVMKDELVFEGVDNAALSLCCARVSQVCRTGRKDVRKFLDGIYVSQKTKIQPKEECQVLPQGLVDFLRLFQNLKHPIKSFVI